MTKGQPEHGAILVAVLLVLTLLAGIAAALVHSGRTGVSTLKAEDALLKRETALRSSLAALGPALSGPHETVRRDGQAFALMRLDDITVTAEVQAVSGLINVNTAPVVLLEGLLRAAALDDQTVYETAGAIDAARRKRPFHEPDELAQFFSNTPALWQQLRPILTVLGRADTLDPDTAPRLALLAVPGMTTEAADALIASRATPAWDTVGRSEAALLYRPFLDGLETQTYVFRLRVGTDRLAQNGVGMLGKDAHFYLIGLDWPSAEEDIAP